MPGHATGVPSCPGDGLGLVVSCCPQAATFPPQGRRSLSPRDTSLCPLTGVRLHTRISDSHPIILQLRVHSGQGTRGQSEQGTKGQSEQGTGPTHPVPASAAPQLCWVDTEQWGHPGAPRSLGQAPACGGTSPRPPALAVPLSPSPLAQLPAAAAHAMIVPFILESYRGGGKGVRPSPGTGGVRSRR